MDTYPQLRKPAEFIYLLLTDPSRVHDIHEATIFEKKLEIRAAERNPTADISLKIGSKVRQENFGGYIEENAEATTHIGSFLENLGQAGASNRSPEELRKTSLENIARKILSLVSPETFRSFYGSGSGEASERSFGALLPDQVTERPDRDDPQHPGNLLS